MLSEGVCLRLFRLRGDLSAIPAVLSLRAGCAFDLYAGLRDYSYVQTVLVSVSSLSVLISLIFVLKLCNVRLQERGAQHFGRVHEHSYLRIANVQDACWAEVQFAS